MKTSSIVAVLSAASAANALPGPAAALRAITARLVSGDAAPAAANHAGLVARSGGRYEDTPPVVYVPYESNDDDEDDDDDGDDDDDDDDDSGYQSSGSGRGRGRGRGRGGDGDGGRGRGGRPGCTTTALAPTPTRPPFVPGGGFGNNTLNGTDILNSTTTSSIVIIATESVSLIDDGGNSNGDGDDSTTPADPVGDLAARAIEAIGAIFGM